MLKKIPGIYTLLLGNLIPLLHLILFGAVFFLDLDRKVQVALAFFVIYLLPPLLARLIYRSHFPQGKFSTSDPAFRQWWVVTQLQALFLRFSFLEEFLRIIPYAYSNWLRLWGSRIGKRIYWSPQIIITDRTHLNIGDGVIVGYGAAFVSHHFNKDSVGMELVLATPVVGDGAILGGASGLGPGACLAPNEMLPSTLALAPFYEWKNGRRQRIE